MIEINPILENLGIAGVILRLFNREVDYWVTAIAAYYKRPYDLDRNPDTHDWCKIYNPGNGKWEIVSLTFQLLPRKSGNGVFVHHYDKTKRPWRVIHRQRVPFLEWKAKDKARLPFQPDVNNTPSEQGLE